MFLDRIVGFQDLVGDNRPFCVECLLEVEKVIEVCIVHDAEVREMEFAVLVDLAFDLGRVVGSPIGLVFVPDSRGLERLERLVGCQKIWPVLGVFVLLEADQLHLDAQIFPAFGHHTFGVAVCRLLAFVVGGSSDIARSP